MRLSLLKAVSVPHFNIVELFSALFRFFEHVLDDSSFFSFY